MFFEHFIIKEKFKKNFSSNNILYSLDGFIFGGRVTKGEIRANSGEGSRV